MEVSIHCECGSHFTLEAEPVNASMPYEVVCQNCWADVTALANQNIAEQEGVEDYTIVVPTLAPPPAPAPTAPSPAPRARKKKSPKKKAAISTEPDSRPKLSLGGAAAAKPTKGKKKKKKKTPERESVGLTKEDSKPKPRKKVMPHKQINPSFIPTFFSALFAGLLGLGIWYGSIVLTNMVIVYVGILVGGIVGGGVKTSAPVTGFKSSAIAATIAVMTMVVGLGMATSSLVVNEAEDIAIENANDSLQDYKVFMTSVSQHPPQANATVLYLKWCQFIEDWKTMAGLTASDIKLAKDDPSISPGRVPQANVTAFANSVLPRLRGLSSIRQAPEDYRTQYVAAIRNSVAANMSLSKGIALSFVDAKCWIVLLFGTIAAIKVSLSG